MKLLLCFGTRPEAIKIAPVIHELKNSNIEFKVAITAQHREMLDQVLDFFEIKPDYDLDLMEPNQSLNDLSGRIISQIDEVLEKEKPNMVLVQGDTTTAFFIAVASFHKGIRVGHIEAGLRTYNKQAPFPEEINRQMIAKIADLHFAPTAQGKSNLLKDLVPKELIHVTGNTVVDALCWAKEKLETLPLNEEAQKIRDSLNYKKKLILVTGHRRENFGQGLEQICKALLNLAQEEDVEIVYPVHLNPKVLGPVKKILNHTRNIHLVSPVSYPTMLWLMQICDLIISDSGGIQEEAPTFNKPVLVTRMFTERTESIDLGFSILVGTDKEKIIFEAKKLLDHPPNLTLMENPYGDGTAAKQIVEVILS